MECIINKKIQTFITVHDQNIIIDFEDIGKFNSFPNLKYILVGNGPYNLVENKTNVLISRNFKNIEDFPNLCSYTAWYTLWKNNLIDADYVNLFEYDINLLTDCNTIIETIKQSNSKHIGYFPLSINNRCYVETNQYVNYIIPAIQKHYNVDILNVISKLDLKYQWVSTSNNTFEVKTFYNYMEWFHCMFEDIKNNQYAGHEHERSVSFFCFINDIKTDFFEGLIKHYELNSHLTSGKSIYEFHNNYKSLL